MKILKIITALFLAIALMPTICMFNASAENVDITETEEYKKLVAFGVLEEKNSELIYYEYVTREMFVMYLMRCMGAYVPYNTSAANNFQDMADSTAEAVTAVAAAAELGIISKSADGNFRPKDNITINEAAKILTTVLGYSTYCEKNGGYPDAYLGKAHQLDVFEGCKFSPEGYITPANYAKMIMNTLESNVLYYDSIFSRNGSYVVKYGNPDGEPLMQIAFDIYKEEGIVTSDEYVSISGPSEVGEDQIAIDSLNYYCDGKNLSEFLGSSVECYYNYDKSADRRTVVYIQLRKNRNEITTIEAADISAETTKDVFHYYDENEKIQKIDIPKSATLIYNGGITSVTAKLLQPAHGDVTFIDNNRDNVIDIIKVMDYRIVKVASVTDLTHRIADDLGGENIELDPDDRKFAIRIEKDGVPAEFSDIDKEDIISYAQSAGNSVNIKYVVVSSQKITGDITSISEDTAEIDGVEYEFDDKLFQGLKLGQSGTFYLDHKGEVVAKTTDDDTVFGYLNKVGTSGTLSKNIMVKMFTENSNWVTLELCQNVKHNGKRVTDDEFYDECLAFGAGDAYRQLVSYTVNGEGKVNRIDFAEDCLVSGTPAEQVMIQNDTFRKSLTASTKRFRTALPSFDNDCLMTTQTKIFMIPDQTKGDAAEDDFYIIKSSGLMEDGDYVNVTAYNMDDMRIAEVIVSVGNPVRVDAKGEIVLLNRIFYKRTPYDEFVPAIEGFYKGAMMSVFVRDSSLLTKYPTIGSGDVVQLAVDAEGYVKDISMLYDYEPNTTFKESISHSNGYNRAVMAIGEVTNIDYENEVYMVDIEGMKYIFGLYSNVYNIYVYDTDTEEMQAGSFADIEIGDTVFAKVRYFWSENIVVYK